MSKISLWNIGRDLNSRSQLSVGEVREFRFANNFRKTLWFVSLFLMSAIWNALSPWIIYLSTNTGSKPTNVVFHVPIHFKFCQPETFTFISVTLDVSSDTKKLQKYWCNQYLSDLWHLQLLKTSTLKVDPGRVKGEILPWRWHGVAQRCISPQLWDLPSGSITNPNLHL
jgi:hypothetical protein